MNADEARKVSKFLLHGWPGDFTEEGLVIYLDALMPLPFEAVATGIKGLLLTRKFRPSIAEIYECAVAQIAAMSPSLDVALIEGAAYFEYLAQLQWSNGSGYEPRKPHAHPAVVRACRAIASSDHFDEITFRKVYESVSRRFDAILLSEITKDQQAVEAAPMKEIEG